MLCSFKNTNRVPNTFSLEFTELNQPPFVLIIYIPIWQLLCILGDTRLQLMFTCGPSDSEHREHRLHVCPAYMLTPLLATAFRTQEWLNNNTWSLQLWDFSLPERVLWHEWRMIEVGAKNRGKGLMRFGDRGQEGTLKEQVRRNAKSKQFLETKGLIK